jgi:hypothetical protein
MKVWVKLLTRGTEESRADDKKFFALHVLDMLKNTIITPDPSQVLQLCQSLAMRASEIA